jgi:hypothetical protein
MNIYKVDVWWDDEGKMWISEGKNFNGLAMGANSLDVLFERTHLAISDLLEIDKFRVEYQIKTEVDYQHG